jgi:hypothetical protein
MRPASQPWQRHDHNASQHGQRDASTSFLLREYWAYCHFYDQKHNPIYFNAGSLDKQRYSGLGLLSVIPDARLPERRLR